jgi:hypothetical protein
MRVALKVPSAEEAAIIKGMLQRGDPQHDIASWFGYNPGRISEINTGKRYPEVPAAPSEKLPPRGPYGRNIAA